MSKLIYKLDSRKIAFMAILAVTAIVGGMPAASAAGFSVQQIKSPGPAVRMSNNANVTGFYVAKCVTLSSQPKRTICYNAPWLYDGKSVSKLSGSFPSNSNAKAVAVNDAAELIGGDLTGAWYYSKGQVDYVDPAGTKVSSLYALNNNGIAVGISSIGGIYQPITYQFNGAPAPALASGYSVVDINDAGMIVGWFKNGTVEQSFVAYSADPGSIVAIPNLMDASGKSINCRPVRISQKNSSGAVWVAGNCAGNRPFLYEASSDSLTELFYPGSSNLSVVSVNSSGMAAGTAVKPGAAAPEGYTALLWAADGASSPLDLNGNHAFAPATAWNVHATDINEAGTVLAGYNDTSGNFYTFLLRPIP